MKKKNASQSNSNPPQKQTVSLEHLKLSLEPRRAIFIPPVEPAQPPANPELEDYSYQMPRPNVLGR